MFTRRAGSGRFAEADQRVEAGSFNVLRADARINGGAIRASTNTSRLASRLNGAFDDLIPEDDELGRTPLTSGRRVRGVAHARPACATQGLWADRSESDGYGARDPGHDDTAISRATSSSPWLGSRDSDRRR